jgi:hypothetical protein
MKYFRCISFFVIGVYFWSVAEMVLLLPGERSHIVSKDAPWGWKGLVCAYLSVSLLSIWGFCHEVLNRNR